MNIGHNILELRKQKHITQEDLAAELGVTAAAVSKWENNYTLPDIMMLCALADYFGVTTDEILGRNGVLKEAVVVAASTELSGKIKQIVERYGFTIVSYFSTYRPALNYALEHENCNHIFVGLQHPLPADETDDTPTHINTIHSFGPEEEGILRGFEEICNHWFSRNK